MPASTPTAARLVDACWRSPGWDSTSPRLGLRSEASARYERGCDPYIIDTAMHRFAELLGETCPDLVVHDGTDDERGPGLPPRERSTTVRIHEVNRILGTDLTADESAELMQLTQECIAALKQCMNPDGFNVGMNIGKCAGAGIEEHLHVHVVPRWSGDTNFMPVLGQTSVLPQALTETADQLRKALSGSAEDHAS